MVTSTVLAAVFYALGALDQLPALRSLLHDRAARVYYPTWLIATVTPVLFVAWPLMTVAGVARLIWNWKRP